jgi:hypothetical protein
MLVMIEDFYTVGNGIINSFEFPDLSESKLGGLTVFRVFECRRHRDRGEGSLEIRPQDGRITRSLFASSGVVKRSEWLGNCVEKGR